MGNNDSKPTPQPQVVKPTSLPEGVSRTKNMDIISWDDDPTTDRFKMPCGHAIGADSLKTYVDDDFANGGYEIRCPKCKQIWQHETIQGILDVSSLESKNIETAKTEHFLYMGRSIQTCPGCGILCERDGHLSRRVICPFCTKFGKKLSFCWYCLREWKSIFGQHCGNRECPGEDPALQILHKCPSAVMQFSEVRCPSIRACPSCFMFIEHDGGCKTMTCKGCKQVFCFVCLKKADSQGKLPCGSYKKSCEVAPIQKHIFSS